LGKGDGTLLGKVDGSLQAPMFFSQNGALTGSIVVSDFNNHQRAVYHAERSTCQRYSRPQYHLTLVRQSHSAVRGPRNQVRGDDLLSVRFTFRRGHSQQVNLDRDRRSWPRLFLDFHVEPVAIHWPTNEGDGLNRSPVGRSASARRARSQPPEILVLSSALRPTSGASPYRKQCAR
jgi:hypothetical protein